jgi:hypothetical protein
MVIDARIEEALKGASAVAQLRALAIILQQEGQEQTLILDFFEKNRQSLREAGRETDEDSLIEVMDFLVGWCSPHMSLAPKRP